MFAWVIASSMCLGAPALKDRTTDRSPVAGRWVYVLHREHETVPHPCTFRADGTVSGWWGRFGEGGLDVRDLQQDVWRYTVEPGANPPRITFMGDGDMPPSEGIFKIEGDTLTICHRKGEGRRPKEFGEKGATLEVLKRAAPRG